MLPALEDVSCGQVLSRDGWCHTLLLAAGRREQLYLALMLPLPTILDCCEDGCSGSTGQGTLPAATCPADVSLLHNAGCTGAGLLLDGDQLRRLDKLMFDGPSAD